MVQGVGCRVQGLGFRVYGLGFRVKGLGFRDKGLGSRVQVYGIRVSSLGFSFWRFRVQGLGLRVQVSRQMHLGGSKEQDDVDGVFARLHQLVHAVVAALDSQDAHAQQGTHAARSQLNHTHYALHLAPHILHLTPYILHLTPYTLHLTPYTLHLTPYTLHPELATRVSDASLPLLHAGMIQVALDQ